MRKNANWMALYAYPSHLTLLEPGDSGVFVCSPERRGHLATVCGIWIKGHTDWVECFPPGTPWNHVFWTERVAEGLKVVRAPLPGATWLSSAVRFRCVPSGSGSLRVTEKLSEALRSWQAEDPS